MMNTLETVYGGKTRVRVCGILRHEGSVLMINHKFINADNIFWNFPGGGLNEGEDIREGLRREFAEETHLEVEIGRLLYINEHIHKKLHAIELYFEVKALAFDAKLGQDPEWNILSAISWFTQPEIDRLPKGHLPDFAKNIAFL